MKGPAYTLASDFDSSGNHFVALAPLRLRSSQVSGYDGAIRVVAYVVSGVGFLGAGAIMKEGANVSGLNTAATLWGSAAVGACAGLGLICEALLTALFVLASNTLLRPVVNRINRTPMQEAFSEATYVVYVICRRDTQAEIHEKLIELLEASNYPVRDVDQHAFGRNDAEIEATLYATAVEPAELDRIMSLLEADPGSCRLSGMHDLRIEDARMTQAGSVASSLRDVAAKA